MNTSEKLQKLRQLMVKFSLDSYIVRTTDKYQNEYIPLEENSRYYISGFTGSTGDMLITKEDAYLIVDGRYYIQAPKEVNLDYITIVQQPVGMSANTVLINKILENGSGKTNYTVGLDGDKNFILLTTEIEETLGRNNICLKIIENDLIEEIKGESPAKTIKELTVVSWELSGNSSEDILPKLNDFLKESCVEALVVTKLESLAYITNLRGYDIPFNSTFRGIGIVTQESILVFTDNCVDKAKLNSPCVQFYKESDFGDVISKLVNVDKVIKTIALIPEETNINIKNRLLQCGANIRNSLKNLIRDMRVQKTEEELRSMRDSFERSDRAFINTIEWVNRGINQNKKISEKDVCEKISEEFYRFRATGLSFNPITGADVNSAVVHYNKHDPKKFLLAGELLLIDAGAYYEAGYATDLTRTILIGGSTVVAKPWQKKLYTTVLKSSLQGLNAVIDEGMTGYDLDKIVRCLNQEFDGFVYNHGTGHGVGISVHEYPPIISNSESAKKFPLRENMVFTIEPGLYKEDVGGVRIENVVAVQQCNEASSGLKIEQLTFAPLDLNLIDMTMLESQERDWLHKFNECMEKKYGILKT